MGMTTPICMKNGPASASHTLGDLFRAVKSVTKNDREIVATVSDLLERGRVQFVSRTGMIRVRVRDGCGRLLDPSAEN